MGDKRTSRERFWWFVHNVIAHPASEVLYWLWLEPWGNAIHDWTIPEHEHEHGRG
jgi:hypothetical protein